MTQYEHAVIERADQPFGAGIQLFLETPKGRNLLDATDTSPGRIRRALDELGRDGWELIGLEAPVLRQQVYWLRRPLAK